MADFVAERMNAMKKATTSKTARLQIANFMGCTGNEMMSLDEAKVKLNGVNGAGGIFALTDQATDGANYTLLSNILASLS